MPSMLESSASISSRFAISSLTRAIWVSMLMAITSSVLSVPTYFDLQFPRRLADQSSDRRALLACVIKGRLDDRHLVCLVEKVERFAKLDREVVFVASLECRQHRNLQSGKSSNPSRPNIFMSSPARCLNSACDSRRSFPIISLLHPRLLIRRVHSCCQPMIPR